MAVAPGAGRDHDRGLRLEALERLHRVVAVAVGPEHERAPDGVATAVPAGAGRAADVDVGAPSERDRSRREGAQPPGSVEDLAHALPVVEAVAQLKQLPGVRVPSDGGEEARGGRAAA